MACLAHEKSHASTSRIAFGYLEDDHRMTKIIELLGMEIMGNQSKKAGVLEEAFANMDSAYITDTILKQSLPELYQERLDVIDESKVIQTIDRDLYGIVTPEMAVPFIVIDKQQTSSGCQIISSRLSISIKEYLLGRKICERVGKTLVENSAEELDIEEAINVGFKTLDMDRYLRTNEAHRKITRVFGVNKAKYLFDLPNHLGGDLARTPRDIVHLVTRSLS